MSSNIIYTSIPEFLHSCKTLKDQMAMIELILANMLIAMNTATTTGQTEEIKLDTGQTRTEIKYRNQQELSKAYDSLYNTYKKLRNDINYQKTGRKFRLVDGKNFI